jgi:hypothetical protein
MPASSRGVEILFQLLSSQEYYHCYVGKECVDQYPVGDAHGILLPPVQVAQDAALPEGLTPAVPHLLVCQGAYADTPVLPSARSPEFQ